MEHTLPLVVGVLQAVPTGFYFDGSLHDPTPSLRDPCAHIRYTGDGDNNVYFHVCEEELRQAQGVRAVSINTSTTPGIPLFKNGRDALTVPYHNLFSLHLSRPATILRTLVRAGYQGEICAYTEDAYVGLEGINTLDMTISSEGLEGKLKERVDALAQLSREVQSSRTQYVLNQS